MFLTWLLLPTHCLITHILSDNYTIGKTTVGMGLALRSGHYLTTHKIYKRLPCLRRYSNPQPQ
jgi:hypothetical protein